MDFTITLPSLDVFLRSALSMSSNSDWKSVSCVERSLVLSAISASTSSGEGSCSGVDMADAEREEPIKDGAGDSKDLFVELAVPALGVDAGGLSAGGVEGSTLAAFCGGLRLWEV